MGKGTKSRYSIVIYENSSKIQGNICFWINSCTVRTYISVLKRIIFWCCQRTNLMKFNSCCLRCIVYTNSIVYKPTQFPALLNGRNIILLWKFYRTGITLLQFWILLFLLLFLHMFEQYPIHFIIGIVLCTMKDLDSINLPIWLWWYFCYFKKSSAFCYAENSFYNSAWHWQISLHHCAVYYNREDSLIVRLHTLH